jgi:hypothetical protein
MNGRSLMAAEPHRDTRAYGVVFDGPAAFQGGRHRSQRSVVDSQSIAVSLRSISHMAGCESILTSGPPCAGR